jgi:hypothetical protein
MVLINTTKLVVKLWCWPISRIGQQIITDERLNTIHGRYAHTAASGIKMLWMSILDSYETFRTRMELPPWTGEKSYISIALGF